MTVEETRVILSAIKTNYLGYFKNVSKSDGFNMLQWWADTYADTDYNLVRAAVKAYIDTDTTGFPPGTGKINELIRNITNTEQLSPNEAVRRIMNAASRSSYNSVEEFEKLPPVLKKLVGSPAQLRTWAAMDSGKLNTIVTSNLMKEYSSMTKKEEIKNALPKDIKALACELSDKYKLEDKNANV